jgi:hypothetical protein
LRRFSVSAIGKLPRISKAEDVRAFFHARVVEYWHVVDSERLRRAARKELEDLELPVGFLDRLSP